VVVLGLVPFWSFILNHLELYGYEEICQTSSGHAAAFSLARRAYKDASSTATHDSYLYLPLRTFCGDRILCARLREAVRDVAEGALTGIRRTVERFRAPWPQARIVLRRGTPASAAMS
jgi:hypothetical protein